MNLRILYMKEIHSIDRYINDEYDYYILTPDNWDDFHYKTSFIVTIIKNQELLDSFHLKLLFRNQEEGDCSYEIINSLLSERTIIDVANIIDELDFISIGNHYEELKEIFEEAELLSLLKILNDITYLMKYDTESKLITIKDDDGFETSLLREQSSKRVYFEGIDRILNSIQIPPSEYHFDFSYTLSKKNYSYNFNFYDEMLPSRINILIGKNGVGKTRTLEELCNYLINPNNSTSIVKRHPNFITNLCVFSYNPYDNFYIYKVGDNISIEYKYLGFNRYKTLDDGIYLDRINDLEDLEIIKILKDKYQNDILEISTKKEDEKKKAINLLVNKINSKYNKNNEDIIIAIDLNLDIVNEKVSDVNNFNVVSFDSFIELCKKDEKKSKYVKRYKPLSEHFISMINQQIPKISYIGLKDYSGSIELFYSFSDFIDIEKSEYEKKLFYFDENENQIRLSSGQRVYTNLVINLFSMIKENSLIIIDEPENTLHPNFEIGFINILNSILEEYNSFAIVATHSSIIAREIPTKFIQMIIVNEENNDVEIQEPVMKSFGASISDITNYIFDDVFYENKPYSNWLEKNIKKYIDLNKDFNEFKEDYIQALSYELLLEANELFRKIKNV